MSRAYSEDLRMRVIRSYLLGMPKVNIIAIFKIGMDTLNRWIRQYLQTGDVKPKQRTRFRARKFSDADLNAYISQHPSATIKEMAAHFSVKPSSIQARLKMLGITYKKPFFMQKGMNRKERNLLSN